MEATMTEWACDLCGEMTDNQMTSSAIAQRPDGFKVEVAFCVGRYRTGHPVKPATVCRKCLKAAGFFLDARIGMREVRDGETK